MIKMENQKIKEKYMEMQYIEQHMKKIEEKLEEIDIQINEINSTKDALNDFNKLKEEKESLVPIANGIFINAKIRNNNKFLINIGNNIITEKTYDEAIKIMDEQLNEINSYQQKLFEQMNQMNAQINILEKEVEGKMKNV